MELKLDKNMGKRQGILIDKKHGKKFRNKQGVKEARSDCPI